MTKREILLERLEETVFALMMDEVAKEEGRRALEENERLKNDDSFIVPKSTYRKGVATIKRYFSQKNRHTTMRAASKVVSKVAVIVLVMLLLFTTAFATIPEFRSKAMNLIIEVFDDRTRIEFGDSFLEAPAEGIVGWIPEGFELVDKGKTDFSVWERYNNAEGDFVETRVYRGDVGVCEIDTEDAKIEECKVSGYSGMMVFKNDTIRLAIPVIESELVYYIQSKGVDGNTVLRMAESMDIR